jgi:hypothetical protein
MNKENQNLNERNGGLIGCLSRLVSDCACLMGMHSPQPYERPTGHQPFRHLTVLECGNECARCGKDLSHGGDVIDGLLKSSGDHIPR